METLKIEILNPKALKLIQGMEDLQLIKVTNTSNSLLQSFLEKMRESAANSPSVEEIALVVEEVRAERYAKK